MRIYFDEYKLSAMLQGTPRALHQRAIEDLEAGANEAGLRTVQSGHLFVDVKLEQGRRESIMQWLLSAPVACVDLQQFDIPTLLGRSLEALMLLRGMQLCNVRINRVTPGELFDRMQEVINELQTAQAQAEADPDDRLAQGFRAQAEQDLVAAGLIERDGGSSSFLEPKAEPDYVIPRQYRDDTPAERVGDLGVDPFNTDGYGPAGF